MKTALYSITLLISVFVLPGAALPQNLEPEALRTLYQELIDDVITHCDSKEIFRDTQSENIRRAVALSVMKGAFLKTYREALVQEMLADGVRPHAATVQFYLNNWFYSILN